MERRGDRSTPYSSDVSSRRERRCRTARGDACRSPQAIPIPVSMGGVHHMHMLTRTAATMGLLGLAIAGPLGGVHHTFAASDVVGYVYVNDNTAGTNTVAGFDRHADGTLTSLPGSPFTVGGSGLGTGIPSQDALQISGDGRYLLAVDAGSNQISVLRIH